MAETAMLWVQYAIVSGVIVYAGAMATRHADQIAAHTGLGRGWIGLTLLATMTSLPEVITGASAIVAFDVPDIAAGDIYGSIVFNLLLVALANGLAGRRFFMALSPNQNARAWASLTLTAMAAASLAAAAWVPRIAWFSVSSIFLLLGYASTMLWLRPRGALADEDERHTGSARRALLLFCLHAAFLVAAAAYLPYLGAEISEATGLVHSFIGNLLVAASTSLPELVTTVAAVRLGSLDLAMGDLLGSNIFDVAILAVDDILYTPGPLFPVLSKRHLLSAVAAIAMNGLVLVALYRRPQRQTLIAPEMWGVVACYALTVLAFLAL